jgi:hypothetical protein
VSLGLVGTVAAAQPPSRILKVYLLAGQSNMEGHGYTHQEGDDWLAKIGYPDGTSIDSLLNHPGYAKQLDASKYTFLPALGPSWLKPRDNVWAIHMDSGSGKPFRVQHTEAARKGEWREGERLLQPGFGNAANDVSKFGPELALGHCLGDRLDSPIYLYKSDHGGTALATAWRSPSAVKQRGGEVGSHYRNTVESFRAFLKRLDADLADDGTLNAYGGATGYEVCGFVWLQGWNDAINPERRAEYEANLIDLVRDLRSDLKQPRLPAVIIESADMNEQLNTARKNAAATLNKDQAKSAVFVPTSGLKAGYKGGFHFEVRAENYLEVGWRAGQAILKEGFVGRQKAPQQR